MLREKDKELKNYKTIITYRAEIFTQEERQPVIEESLKLLLHLDLDNSIPFLITLSVIFFAKSQTYIHRQGLWPSLCYPINFDRSEVGVEATD